MGPSNKDVGQTTSKSDVEDYHAAEMMKIYIIPKGNLAFLSALAALIFASSILIAFPVQPAQALDGNLYVINAATSEIRRYSGTTGEFMDDFVAAGSGDLGIPIKMTFGPDANLYVLNGNSPYAINRYDGVSGAFIDEFIARSSVAESIVAGFAFAAPPPVLQKQALIGDHSRRCKSVISQLFERLTVPRNFHHHTSCMAATYMV